MKYENKKTVAIVGLNPRGIAIASRARQNGHRVIGIDRRRDPRHTSDAIDIERSSDFSRLEPASIVFICTPLDENPAPLRVACEKVGPHIQKGQLVILEANPVPDAAFTITLPILESRSRMKGGLDFDLAVASVASVVRAVDAVSARRAKSFYRSVIGPPQLITK